MSIKNFVGIFVLLQLLDHAVGTARCQDTSSAMVWYAQTAANVLKNSRAMIEPNLSRDELMVARGITYRITDSPGIGAFAAYEDNKPII